MRESFEPFPAENPEGGAASERALARRLARTESEVKRVDLFSTLTALATLTSAMLLVGILLDHWGLRGGLSPKTRLLFFCSGLTILGAFFFRRLFPLLRYRINPLYAAQILEASRPSLKTGLINWLLLRRGKESGYDGPVAPRIDPHVERQLAIQTAGEVERIPREIVVDHAPVIRWGFALVAVLTILSVYSVLTPKSPITSGVRILLPTAQVAAPQSVRFLRVEPGDGRFYQGKRVRIEAEVSGCGDRPVFVEWGTSDGRITRQRILTESTGLNRFAVEFPPEGGGLVESVDYRIRVGDQEPPEGFSSTFRLDVLPAMIFTVERLTLHFPSYLGRGPEERFSQGDILAPEGSRVEIFGRSNIEITKALFVPDVTLARAERMTIDPDDATRASVSITVKPTGRRNPDTGELLPTLESYQLLCFDADGEKNIADPEDRNNTERHYVVRMIEDLPPEVAWRESTEESIADPAEIPLNGEETLKIRAFDPDYGLRGLRVRFERRDDEATYAAMAVRRLRKEPIPPMELLDGGEQDGRTGFTGSVERSAILRPAQLGLVPGEKIEYYAEATDTKLPEANIAVTPRRVFVVMPPTGEKGMVSGDAGGTDPSRSQGGGSGQSSSESSENGESSGGTDSSDGSNSGAGEDSENAEGGEGDSNGDSAGSAGESEGSEGGGESSEGQSGKSSHGSGGGSDDDNGKDSQNKEAGEGSGEKNSSGGENSPSQGVKPSDSGAGGETGTESGATTEGENPDESPTSPENRPENGGNSGNKNTQSPQSSENSGSGAQENPSDGTNPGESPSKEPVDSQADPGEAFERIRDFIEKEKAPSNPKSPKLPGDVTDLADSGDFSGTTDAAPSDAPRISDPNPTKIPENATRKTGELDPDTKNFMTTDRSPNPNSAGERPSANANVLRDPQSSSGTPAAPDERPDSPSLAGETPPNPRGGEEGEPVEPSATAKPTEGSPPSNTSPNPPDSGGSDSSASNPPASPGSDHPGAAGVPGTSPTKKTEDNSNESLGGGDGDPPPTRQTAGPGGRQAGDVADAPPPDPADEANLKYTEAVTALVLEYLDEQIQNGPDPSLLRGLGWSEDELRQFRNRWNEMKENARTLPPNDPQQREYLEQLRDLGLRPPRDPNDLTATARSEEFRTSGQTSQALRVAPPAGFERRARAFHEGVARERK